MVKLKQIYSQTSLFAAASSYYMDENVSQTHDDKQHHQVLPDEVPSAAAEDKAYAPFGVGMALESALERDYFHFHLHWTRVNSEEQGSMRTGDPKTRALH